METEQANSIFENISRKFRQSVTVKLFSILVLMLLLLIPLAYVDSLITERKYLSIRAVDEVSQKWANDQLIYGPILTVPAGEWVQIGEHDQLVKRDIHLLPSSLQIEGNIEPETLNRGIYEVVVYDSKVSLSGDFDEFGKFQESLKRYDEVYWDDAFITIHISDLRGIKEKVLLNWNGNPKSVKPGSSIPKLIASGITVDDLFEGKPDSESLKFSLDLMLQGSQKLSFIPMGKETDVHLTSSWKDPSFTGSFLPDERTVTENGFTSTYKILELNRNFPQSWTGDRNTAAIMESEFGVDLILPVNNYTKASRSSKYALLAISLTFLTFFLVEIFNNKNLHPFQYILIGFALILFYTLLVSISEQSNFDLAYLISSVSVISMIGLYSKSILKDLKQSLLLIFILTLTYTFVYITLQVQDYALLIGSIGLTSILALTMYITRNINWYELNVSGKNQTPVQS
tara:strand:- start:6403 stop:7776 length:1374 start_codon:yes stop_codon:yes gene_type:complete